MAKTKAPPEVGLTFTRIALLGSPEKLLELAERQPDQKDKLTACAGVLKGWLAQPGNRIHCYRSEASWLWLQGAAKTAGLHTFSTLIGLKLVERECQIEADEEKRDFDRRVAEAMAEYKAGGGE